MLSEAYLGLGSNLGDSAQNLRAAVRMLEGCAVDVVPSPIYRTAPLGFQNQPAFCNAVCRIATRLTPFELMDRLLHIEAAVGRRRVFQNAPRILDMDILMYGRRVLKSPPLVLPHPRMTEREFVLRPLADIAPNLKHPVSGIAVADMLRNLAGNPEAMSRIAW